MLFEGRASLSWWRFVGGMAFVLLPLGFIAYVLVREGESFQVIVLLMVSVSAVAYAALRWRGLRKQFNGDADAAATAIRRNPFGLATGSPRLLVVWVASTSLVAIVSVIAWAFWRTLR